MPEFPQELVSSMTSGTVAMLALVCFVFFRAAWVTRRYSMIFWIGLSLTAWFLAAYFLSGHNKFFLKLSLFPLPNIGLLFVPMIIGLTVLAKSKAFREVVDNISQVLIVGVQVTRVMGVTFLVLYARGLMPAEFAFPSGIGDIVIGVLAPLVAVLLFSKPVTGRKVAIVWNFVGFADLALAIFLGFLTSPTPYQGLAFDNPNFLLFDFPLALVPTFAVPLSLLLHIFSLRVLLKKNKLAS